jgi:hypothetical protein
MRFNRHLDLTGKHAFLSPSSYHWLNYDDQKLTARFYAANAAIRGTNLHALAHNAIRLRVRLDDVSESLAAYVNDAIDLGMIPEQTLYYSENCFGTADTILFADGVLRVHDLKTGIIATSEKQLEVYAALFCLEYYVDPLEIEFELRIYQRDEIRIYTPTPEMILSIMDKIILFDKHLETLKED